jgi:hypothetical protein
LESCRCEGGVALEAEAMTSVIMLDCGVWQASRRAGWLVVKRGESVSAAPVAAVCRLAILSIVAGGAGADAARDVWQRLAPVVHALRESAPEVAQDVAVLSCDEAASWFASRMGGAGERDVRAS